MAARAWPVAGWRRVLVAAVWLAVAALLLWVVLNVPLPAIWRTLSQLALWQIVLLLVVNAAVFLAFSARWWVLLSALGHRVSFGYLALHRLAGFGLSYFSPGPQVGGEAVQLLLLQRRHSVPVASGAASVGSDRLLEAIVNLTMLTLGLAVTLQTRVLAAVSGPGALLPVMLLLALPVIYVVLLSTGRTPLIVQLGRLPDRIRVIPRIQRLEEAAGAIEQQVAVLFRDRPRAVLLALAASLVSWAMMIAEYGLMLLFLRVEVTPVQLISMMTFARLAFLLPVPGGLGTLEAGQILIFGVLGLDPAQGLSASLLIRGRDVLFGLAGLWWVSLYGRKGRGNE